MNELEQFLKNNEPEEEDIFNQPLTPEPEKDEGGKKSEEDEEEQDEDGFKPKTRRERRLMRKLQAERESSIFLSGKLEARTEAEKVLINEKADYLEGIERIYGTDSPEAQMATELLKKAIVGARDDAENRAYERLKNERQREQQEIAEAESELESIIEELEDANDFTFTSAQEKAYFQLLQKMSPKDRSGNVISLADPQAVYEIFSERLKTKGTNTQAKVLSNRSMTQSGASTEPTLQDDVMARQLREMGII